MRRIALLGLAMLALGPGVATSATPGGGSTDAGLIARRLGAHADRVTPVAQSGAVVALRVVVPGGSGTVVSVYPMESALEALRLDVGLQASIAAHPGRVAVTFRGAHAYVARTRGSAPIPTAAVAAIVRVAEGSGGFAGDGGVLHVYRIPSPSMQPAIPVGSIAVVARRGFAIRRGGIYVIHPNGPDGAGLSYVKRVIGLPGDRIQGIHGLVRICSGPGGRTCRNLDERYVSSTQSNFPLTRVPVGRYFVMGDNREFSDDSRDFGAIPAAQFVGRLVEVVG